MSLLELFCDVDEFCNAFNDFVQARGLAAGSGQKRGPKSMLALSEVMPLMDKLLLRKRAIIESINEQLKNISQIAHTRHLSVDNFMVNLVAGLIAYTWQPKKPSLSLANEDAALLPVLI